MISNEFLHLRPSRHETAIERDEQLVQLLTVRLEPFGYQLDAVHEDWGWWVGVVQAKAKMAIGVYGVDQDTIAREFAVTIFTERTKRWVFWPFLSHSIETELIELRRHVAEILRGANEIMIIAETDTFPL